jgi:hypothetical protein
LFPEACNDAPRGTSIPVSGNFVPDSELAPLRLSSR